MITDVLFQKFDNILYLIVFFSHKMLPAEINYDIYDKKLLIIIRAFKEWESELASVPTEIPTKVLSDYQNLQYFIITKKLTRR